MTPKRFLSLILVPLMLLIASAVFSIAADAPPTPNEPSFVSWPWQVSIAPDTDSETQKVAADLAFALFREPPLAIVTKSPTNPVCCLRLEITRWTPNPGQPGYIILIQGGGGIVLASDVGQMNVAVEKLKSVIQWKEGKPHLPLGMLTNYPMMQTAVAAKSGQ